MPMQTALGAQSAKHCDCAPGSLTLRDQAARSGGFKTLSLLKDSDAMFHKSKHFSQFVFVVLLFSMRIQLQLGIVAEMFQLPVHAS